MSLLESGAHNRRTLLVGGLGAAAAGAVGAGQANAAPPPGGPGPEMPGHRVGGDRGAIHVPAGTGPAYWLNGDTYTFKAVSEQTLLTFSLIEASVPPAGGPPAHTHPIADEAFYLLSGQLEFTVGNDEIEVKAGDFVYVPHGLEHKFRNVGVPTAQMLYLFAPGGPEYALMGWGTPAEPGVPVPPPDPHRPSPMAGRWPDHPTKPEHPGRPDRPPRPNS